MLLNRYQECLTDNLEEMASSLEANAGGRILKLKPLAPNFCFCANAARLNELDVITADCPADAEFSYEPVSYDRLILQTRKTSQVVVGPRIIDSIPGGTGYIIPSGEGWQVTHPDGFQILALRADHQAIERLFLALVDHDSDRGLYFEPAPDSIVGGAGLMRQALFQFAHEIDSFDRSLPREAIAALEKSIMVRLLLLRSHSGSHLLRSEPLRPSRTQLRRVEEHLAANWDRPFDIERLAAVAGVSIRTIFRNFRSVYGCSPQAFHKRIRLEKARSLLADGAGDASVIQVALRCRFQSFGHFARAYREAFGEQPSVTLRRTGKGNRPA